MALSRFLLIEGRKAMFFTLIAIMIVAMFVVYFKMQTDIPLKTKVEVAEMRITSMNDFVRSFEEIYAQRALYAISHNALNFMTLYLNETETNRNPADRRFFFSNISEAFQMAVLKSEIPGKGGVVSLGGMQNMNYWLEKLANTTRKELGADFNFTIYGIHLEQDYETGPWRARAVMEIGYMINTSGIAKWERYPAPIKAEFEVTEFIDPYLAVMSNGTLNRKIYISRFNPRQIEAVEDFMKLIESGNYTFENYTAPSFLYRFEGNTSNSSCCGIESFVYPRIVYETVSDTDDYGSSYLDFQFWSGRCFDEENLNQDTALWNATEIYGLYDYFKLDSYHRFNVYPNTKAKYEEAHYGDITGMHCNYVAPSP